MKKAKLHIKNGLRIRRLNHVYKSRHLWLPWLIAIIKSRSWGGKDYILWKFARSCRVNGLVLSFTRQEKNFNQRLFEFKGFRYRHLWKSYACSSQRDLKTLCDESFKKIIDPCEKVRIAHHDWTSHIGTDKTSIYRTNEVCILG